MVEYRNVYAKLTYTVPTNIQIHALIIEVLQVYPLCIMRRPEGGGLVYNSLD